MMLGYEKLFIILRTLIIRKTLFMQYNVLHHIVLSRSKILLTYLMLCYGYTHIIKSDAEHKRNSHDMKLNTSYPFMLKSKFSEIQSFLNSNEILSKLEISWAIVLVVLAFLVKTLFSNFSLALCQSEYIAKLLKVIELTFCDNSIGHFLNSDL
ncbi:hypothetical protein T11_13314 [Trichinella zimbabwensis]|uniref:Uncharacterized protein n=1 Tax=Trichinella zimbabwensis TaxID=268475 RepID=A0A0V1GSL6_9BILA|nr:hypothetical protein T11_13314 [Trichinella zimbabwensis]